jgi:hypothetical protein
MDDGFTELRNQHELEAGSNANGASVGTNPGDGIASNLPEGGIALAPEMGTVSDASARAIKFGATELLLFVNRHVDTAPLVDVIPQKGKGYKKCIGTYLHRDGKPRPKIFWLGKRRQVARRQATILQCLHGLLKESGHLHWTEESLAMASQLIAMTQDTWDTLAGEMHRFLVREDYLLAGGGAAATAAPVLAAQRTVLVEPPLVTRRMLHESMDAWVSRLEQRRDAGDLSGDYAARAKSTVRNLKLAMVEQVVDEIGIGPLETCRLWFQAALAVPKGRPGHKAWDTVKTEMSHARAMFRWFAEQGWWSEPSRWEKALRPAMTAQADDDAEDGDDEPVVYTIDELVKLFAKANANQRVFMLCGLNFAWGQKELATARKHHWRVQDDGRVLVKRPRHKRTRNSKPVYAQWYVWPETWALAKPRMDKTSDDPKVNPKRLAFLTQDGLPLVRRDRSKCDAVGQSFDRLCDAARVENKGFYALRRTALDMIDDIAGETSAQLMAAQKPRTILRKHYVRRKWNKLHKAMRAMRRRLQPMFEASEVKAGHPVTSVT